MAGAQVVLADSLTQLGPRRPALIYVNSPSNPTGSVLGADHLRKVVGFARERGALVVSDECYIGLGWDAEPVSLLSDEVSGGDHTACWPRTRCRRAARWPVTARVSSRAMRT